MKIPQNYTFSPNVFHVIGDSGAQNSGGKPSPAIATSGLHLSEAEAGGDDLFSFEVS